jgi:DNA-binding NarL/FixJ family response regulator
LPARGSETREVEVLGLVAAGASNEDIAERLFLSLKTIESHLRRMFDRYGVMNRTELAVLALKEGWVSAS